MIVLCLLGALLAIVASGFYSGSETGLYCLNRLSLRVDADRGDAAAQRLRRVVRSEQRALSTVLVGTNVSNYLATMFVAMLLGSVWGIAGGASELYTTAIVTPVIFVFGEVVPKILYQRHADQWMRSGSQVLAGSHWLFRWPVAVLNRIAKPVLKLVDPVGIAETSDPRRRMALLLQDALARDEDAGEQLAFVDRVLGLSSVALHQVMAPRNRVVSMRADADRKYLLSLVRKHPHSRFPVYEDHPRRVIGYVPVHNLLADTDWTCVGERVRRLETLEAHESVASAIVRLQAARENIAAVVDRQGLLVGLVTLKDLLEELTGELHDW